MSVVIDKCMCEQKRFDMLVPIAKEHGLDLRGLAKVTGCGTHCGWCVAYLRRALQTGETSFSVLLDKEHL